MTIYAFRCTAAGHELEEFFALGYAPEQITCPDHQSPARRMVSRGNFSRVPGGHNATYAGKP